MKRTINAKRYDTDKCECLGEYDHNYNGNYCGTTKLMRATNGQLLRWTEGNGQDLHLRDHVEEVQDVELDLDMFDLDDEQEVRLVELGLLTIV